MSTAPTPALQPGARTPDKLPLGVELIALAVVLPMGWLAQLIATDLSPGRAALGMLVLAAIAVLGILIARPTARLRLPAVAWVSVVGILASIPAFPWGGFVVEMVGEIDFLALSVPCLAFAGLAITTRELDIVKRSGWKLLIVGVFVLIGTFLGSAVVAHLTLGLMG
ncbi:hypothetical protein [Sediminivirga luteola]|uniref:DUF340 domain-containing protein n=1 Tax=Sediminivirga luteola TaxID=1774748 RepID=A0A8J2TW68_9MICO|nr:hypothetical protein [Sediminivirga luteola]GGA06451.1 hypothetical protein GCM10011333_06780 [Sediminivirga luteola]